MFRPPVMVIERNQISTLSSTGKSHGIISRKPSQGQTRLDSERVYVKFVLREVINVECIDEIYYTLYFLYPFFKKKEGVVYGKTR